MKMINLLMIVIMFCNVSCEVDQDVMGEYKKFERVSNPWGYAGLDEIWSDVPLVVPYSDIVSRYFNKHLGGEYVDLRFEEGCGVNEVAVSGLEDEALTRDCCFITAPIEYDDFLKSIGFELIK